MTADAATLPEGWDYQQVSDVLKLRNGYPFKPTDWASSGRPIIRIQNLKSDAVAHNYYQGELPDRFKAQPGDLLFAWSGTPGTSFGAHIWEGPEAWVNQHIFRVDFSEDDFDRDFLKLALTYNLADYIEQAQGGVGLAHITKAKLDQSLLVHPPVPAQKAIAAMAARHEALRNKAIAHLSAAKRSVELFRRAVLASACTGQLTEGWREANPASNPADLAAAHQRRANQTGRRFKTSTPNLHADDTPLPEAWQRSPLGIVLREIKYGTSKRSEYGGNGIPVLRIPNVSGGQLDVSDLKFAPLGAKEADALLLRLGDLLMIRSNGSVQLVGKTLPITEEAVDMAYAGYLMRLRVDEEVLLPEFLHLALSSPDIRQQVEMPLRSTSGINNINTDEVRGLVIPVPPIEEQKEIVRRAAKLLSTADTLLGRLPSAYRAVERTDQAILVKAFRGELVQ